MGVGRYFCVALPFILTVASIIAALIVGLTGVTSNDLYLFRIDVSNLSIDASQLQEFVNNASALSSGTSLEDLTDQFGDKINEATKNASDEVQDIVSRSPVEWHDVSFLKASTADDVVQAIDGKEIKASDLGLANVYDFTLWGVCSTPQEGKRNCSKAEFDWASSKLSLDWLEKLVEESQLNVTLPKELNDGLKLYATITKWTEVVFIIAIIALALELVVGLFTACSRAVSCVTWIISGFATAAMIATAVLLTVTGATVTGIVLGVAHDYGVKAGVNTSFLAVVWLGVAFAIGAGLFWLLSICCCKPENRPYVKASRHGNNEKFVPNGSYAPIGENRSSAYSGYNYNGPQHGARSESAYEPYSHARV